MYVTKLEVWLDTGYAENGSEVPSPSDVLPSPDFTFTDLHPSVEDIFSAVKIKQAYPSLMSASYLRITYSDIDIPVYAWVDRVSEMSEKPTHVTRIAYHIDLWRTYLPQAKLGYGLVERRPRGEADPIQNCSYRYRLASDPKPIVNVLDVGKVDTYDYGKIWWLIVNLVADSDDGKKTDIRSYFAPVYTGPDAWAGSVTVRYYEGSITKPRTGHSLSLGYWVTGEALSKMGYSATQVSSCFISPVCPVYASGKGTSDDPVVLMQGLENYTNTLSSVTVDGYMLVYNSAAMYAERSVEISLRTTDTEEIIVTGFDGTPIGSVPWGIPITKLTYRTVISSTSAYLDFRADGVDSASEGTHWAIPLPSVDIVSNSWSDYVYSGQRDYDIQQRSIAAKQALVSSITGGMQNTVSTGIMGGLKDTKTSTMVVSDKQFLEMDGQLIQASNMDQLYAKMSKVNNPLRGTGMALGAMAGVSLIGAGIDYATTLKFNQQLQSATDTLQAKQFDSVQLPGSGWDFLHFGRVPSVIVLAPDAYSLDRFAQDIQYNGVQCSEPTADCTALVNAGGPLRIQQLIVTGEIPVQAKAMIANTLGKGVRILTKHTEVTDNDTTEIDTTDTEEGD